MMIGFNKVIGAVLAGVVALLIAAPPSAAQEKRQTTAPTSKRPAAAKKLHHLVLQVDTNEPAMMNLALNNATNVAQYYKDRGEKVEIEVVTFGPGLHMLRDDTSPVALATSAQAMPVAPIQQSDGMITSVAYGCGPFRTRVRGVCVARTLAVNNS